MPSKSKKQRKFIFAKRNQYKTKANTPKEWQWIWDKDWEKVQEIFLDIPLPYKYYKELIHEDSIKVNGYESPQFNPSEITDKEIRILGKTYSNCRENGGDKTTCSKIAWASVNKYRKKKNKK